MLEDAIRTQLAAYLQRIVQPVELVASLDDSSSAGEMRELLQEIAALHPQMVSARFDGDASRRPSFRITRRGADMGVSFAAIPMGHEFTSLVLALLQAGGHPPKVEQALIDQVKTLEPGQDLVFETWMSLTCHNCPDVVQAFNLMAVLNPRIRHTAIDGALFQQEVEERQILAVPLVFLNGEVFASGRMELAEILAKVDTGAAQRAAAELSTRAPYDILIVGGGPAGAAAAVYAARKGIRTGVVAERFGGQTLDTLGIENYISVLETQGPKFAAALEAHAVQYGVDIMRMQRGARLVPAGEPGGPVRVQLESGAELSARSVILATGARWRELGVPGEKEYRNKGVAYCPHCDGPLFKGKRVAVVGGGNSGVEAAIDLAGIVGHVTLIEFAAELRADSVLVERMKSLPNVTIHTSAQTIEVRGEGGKVNALVYKDRDSGTEHVVELEGVFVQIGLIPNTEWLKDSLSLSRYGEIEVDAKGATNVPGVFAAGDATTVPFKQIVIAAGDGAKAALGAFDYLIRSGTPSASVSVSASASASPERAVA